MARNPKFAVLEIDGEELGSPSEYIPVSEDIFFEENSSETLKQKLDLIVSDIASKPTDLINSGDSLTIVINKHHLIVSEMRNLGAIINNGILGVL